jgi:outer membrane protein TolC
VQPVTGLQAARAEYRGLQFGEQAAGHDAKAARKELILTVTEAYLKALQAAQVQRLTELSVEQIEAHVRRARNFQEHGLLARNEVLEAEVRLAEARYKLAQTRGDGRLARSNLAFEIGLPSDEAVWPEPLPELSARSTATSTGPLPSTVQRSELEAVRARLGQARMGERAARAQTIPELNVLLSTQHVEGTKFAPEDAWFVGAQFSWSVFDGGAKRRAIDAARARAHQLEAAEVRASEGLRLEVLQAQVQLETAVEQIRVTRVALAQAEENLRSAVRRHEHQAASTTDLLDAQALRDSTQVREAVAVFAAYGAQARFRRAQGLDPLPFEGGDAQ